MSNLKLGNWETVGPTAPVSVGPTHIVCVYGGKPHTSSDDGQTWSELTTFPTKNYMGVGYDESTGLYWFSVYDEGVFSSSDLLSLTSVFTGIGTRRLNYLACGNGKVSIGAELPGGNSGEYYHSDDGVSFALVLAYSNGAQLYGCCYDGSQVILSGQVHDPYDPAVPGSLFYGNIGGVVITTQHQGNYHRGVAVIDGKLYYCSQGEFITHAPRTGATSFDLSQRTATTRTVRQAAKSNSGQIIVSCSNAKIAKFDPVAHTFADTGSPVKYWMQVAWIPSQQTPAPTYSRGIHDLLVLPSGHAETTESLAQRVDVRLRTFIGEHWLNPELGVPWFEEFLRKAPDLAVCRQILITVLQDVPGVVQVESLTVDFAKSSRQLRVSFSVSGTDSIPQQGTTAVNL